jgi:hypothetical protein
MDKNKIKEALKKKLKQEMSMTGAGASVTPGAGEGVATKYAFGKSNNKGTPKDWKAAPSIPNRPSKAMDYKELWEGKEITTIDDITATLASDASKNIKIPKGSKVKVLIKRMPNEPKVTQLDYNGEKVNVNAGSFIQQYLSLEEENIEEAKVIGKTKSGKDIYLNFDNPAHKDFTAADHDDASQALLTGKSAASISPAKRAAARQHFDASKAKQKGLNENYARFRNETKTRTKPEQFHNAVKSVKQKVNEINRLFEYMNRLQSELSESEGGLKHKKYTDKAIQSIKESTKQLFFKSTKLK